MDKRSGVPIVVLTGILILSLLIVYNNQMVYGGEKGLILASIHKLMSKDVIKISGNVTLNQEVSNEYTALEFLFNGDIDLKENKTLIECYIEAGGYMMDTPIATYVKNADVNQLSLSWGESESEILFDGYGLDTLNVMLTAESVESLYESAEVYKALITDPRPGYRHLTIHTTCYEYHTSINDALPTDMLQDVLVKVYVDGGANILLVALSAHGNNGVVEADISLK